MYTRSRIPLSQARPGMILSQPVLAPLKKIILLTEGTILTSKLIDYLASAGCRSLEVGEAFDNAAVAFWRETQEFLKAYDKMLGTLENLFDMLKSSENLPTQEFKNIALLTMNMGDSQDILKLLNSLEETDENTLKHCLNVGLIAGALAKWMDLPPKEVFNVVLAGLIHDVGKMKIPDKILNKPDLLLHYETMVVRCHPIHSFELIRSALDLPETVTKAVLQHHERLDGSGYPSRLEGMDISLPAQLIAVADIYEAMTSPRTYREALSPLDAIDLLTNQMFGKLNPVACSLITDKIKSHITGNLVTLSDGQNAQIISFGQHYDCRPLLQLASGDYLDLEKHPQIQITKVVDF